MRGLRIGTVLDLRRNDERETAPNRWPRDMQPVTRVFDSAPELQAVRAGGWHASLEDPSFDAERARLWMIDTYARMPAALAPAVSAAISHASTPQTSDTPLLVHCTAGKDRTGFASALLLTLLGVPWDAVMDDYLRTNELWTGHIGRYPELDIDTRAAIVEARTPYLEAAFEVVRADFGGPEQFAERALGLDAAARERIRADLLEG